MEAFCNESVGNGDRMRRRRQGLLPDILVEPLIGPEMRVVTDRTLFELKQINLVFICMYLLPDEVQWRSGEIGKVGMG